MLLARAAAVVCPPVALPEAAQLPAEAPLVIVGAGPVGVRCAQELLRRGYPGQILLFGAGLGGVLGDGRVSGVRLRDGRELACDTVLLDPPERRAGAGGTVSGARSAVSPRLAWPCSAC